jgi:citryl-CoA lyase
MNNKTQDGSAAYWTTQVSDVEDADVYVRGFSLGDLIGKISFSSATYLLVRGEIPTPGHCRMMDAFLCSILDYSLYKPGTAAARYCVSGNPQMTAGLATAVLSVGEYTLAPEDTGRFIASSYLQFKDSGRAAEDYAREFVAEFQKSGKRVPGLGHPKFKHTDPRAQGLKRIAVDEGLWGAACDWYEAIHRAFIAHVNKPHIPINEVGMMAAIMYQMGFTPEEMTGIAIMSSLPGVIAHVSEELRSGHRIRIIPDQIASYPRLRRDLNSELKSKGWDESRKALSGPATQMKSVS